MSLEVSFCVMVRQKKKENQKGGHGLWKTQRQAQTFTQLGS